MILPVRGTEATTSDHGFVTYIWVVHTYCKVSLIKEKYWKLTPRIMNLLSLTAPIIPKMQTNIENRPAANISPSVVI